jgi:hypothetical protein
VGGRVDWFIHCWVAWRVLNMFAVIGGLGDWLLDWWLDLVHGMLVSVPLLLDRSSCHNRTAVRAQWLLRIACMIRYHSSKSCMYSAFRTAAISILARGLSCCWVQRHAMYVKCGRIRQHSSTAHLLRCTRRISCDLPHAAWPAASSCCSPCSCSWMTEVHSWMAPISSCSAPRQYHNC